jgi:hypothetical protein
MNLQMEPKVKVLICSVSVDGEESAESVWADKLGGDSYRIQNIPFLAYNVSLHDVVLAQTDENTGAPVFQKVRAKSGNRTFRLHLSCSIRWHWIARRKLQKLVVLGCDYVFANPRFAAVNVPAEVDVGIVESILDKMTRRWERGDPASED